MICRVEPLQFIVRFYKDKETADRRGPYEGVANVILLDKRTASVIGLHGHIDREALRCLTEELSRYGVTTIVAERRGKPVTYSLEDL